MRFMKQHHHYDGQASKPAACVEARRFCVEETVLLMKCVFASRHREELSEARALAAFLQRQLALRESTAAAELAASSAQLREARQQLRGLQAQLSTAPGAVLGCICAFRGSAAAITKRKTSRCGTAKGCLLKKVFAGLCKQGAGGWSIGTT